MNKNCDTELAIARIADLPLHVVDPQAYPYGYGYGDGYGCGYCFGYGDGYGDGHDGNGRSPRHDS